MEKVSPTRMNLLSKRDEIKQVSDGIELLRNKRDVLLREFFLTVKPLRAMRGQFSSSAQRAVSSLALSLGFDGKEILAAQSLAAQKELEVDLTEKNLWGVRVPQLDAKMPDARAAPGGIDISLHAGDARERFVEFIQLAFKVLPEEVKSKRLGKEIKSTSRKINYLEKYVLPGLFHQIQYIRETLEERESEDIFRLRRIKKKKACAGNDEG